MSWTDERVNLLEKLCGDELSFGQIAAEINRQTGSNFSRNAAIGAAGRRGFIKVRRVSDDQRKSFRGLNGRIVANIQRRMRKPRKGQAAPIEEHLPPPRADFLGIKFVDLADGQCRFPQGDTPNMLFCGQPVKKDSSYCPDCHAVCWLKPTKYVPKSVYVPFRGRAA